MIKQVLKAFIAMFLWLPLLYSVVFLIISIATATVGANWGFYFVGLSVTLIACVALTYVYANRVKREKPHTDSEPPRQAQSAVQPIRYDYEDESADITTRDEANRYAAEMIGDPSAASGERYDRRERSAYMAGGRYLDTSPAPDPATTPDSLHRGDALMGAKGMEEYYFGEKGSSSEKAKQPADGSTFSPYVQPSNYGGDDGIRLSEYDEARTRDREPVRNSDFGEDQGGPAPRIYRLRGEPNVLLYEYPDVYKKYYINADGSRTLLATQYKDKQ